MTIDWKSGIEKAGTLNEIQSVFAMLFPFAVDIGEIAVLESAAAVRTPITVEENIQRGKDAMKRVIAQHVNEPKAMYRKDLGWIAFYWGKEGGPPPKYKGGSGVAKIIAKRDWEGKNVKALLGQKGEEVALKLLSVIAKGSVKPILGKRAEVSYGGYTAYLSSDRYGKEEIWLLTGFKDTESYTIINPDVLGADPDAAKSTHDEPTLSVSHHGSGVINNITNNKNSVKPILESAILDKEANSSDWRSLISHAKSFDNIESVFATMFGPAVVKRFIFGEISDLEDQIRAMRASLAQVAGGAAMESGENGIVMGEKTTAYLNDNTPIELQYAVIEADRLVTSHTDEMSLNQGFSQDLQPRDRAREGMKFQVEQMAGKLNPERLGESTSVSTGAPIIGRDLTVESGNGRTIAIRKAYAMGDKGQEYKQWLLDNSERFGISFATVEQMTRPVLVRVRITEIDRAEFARKANEDEIAQMAPSELARADAAKLTDHDIALFQPSEDGNIAATTNWAFITRFFEKMGANASTGYITRDGSYTKQLVDRVQAAIFQKAYQDDNLLALMSEEADPKIKNILGAMTIAAGEFSRAKAVDPSLMGIDIPHHVIEAAKLIKKSREDNQVIEEVLAQGGLFEDIAEDTKHITLFIDKNIRSARRMGSVLKESARILRKRLIDEKEPKLIDTGEPLPTPSFIIDLAIEKERAMREGGGSLFEALNEGRVTAMDFILESGEFDWKAAITNASSFSDIESVFQVLFTMLLTKPIPAMPSGTQIKKVTYKIVKRGRKWFDAVDPGKGYKAQVEINQYSESFEEGKEYTFIAGVHFESSRYGTSVKIYPLDDKAASEVMQAQKEQKAIPEIQRWLGYVEEKAKEGYLYSKGAETLISLGIEKYPEFNERFQAAKKLVAVNGAKNTITNNLAYIRDNLSKYWYAKGENNVLESLKRLKDTGVDTSEYEMKLEDLRTQNASMATAKAEEEKKSKVMEETGGYEGPTFRLGGGSGNGYRGWAKGQVVRNSKERVAKGEPEYLYILSASSRYFKYDGMSFGVGDESGYTYGAVARAATDDEAIPLKETEAKASNVRQARLGLQNIAAKIREVGKQPEGDNFAEGDEIDLSDKSTRLYGGGEWFVIGKEFIWYVRNNGMDGDNWSHNNVRTGGAGAIGWRISFDEAIANEIIKNHEIIKGGKAWN
jgi:hypothetical protein